MTTAEFLSSLRRLDVRVWVEKGEIHCNAPKGVLTPALRAELTEREAEILAFVRSAASTARLAEFPLQRISRNGSLPLSFAQQRLWFLDQLEPGNVAYNMSAAVRLKGPLDVAALEQSLGEIMRRHEGLRTSFVVVDGQAAQVIAPAEPFKLALVDLQGVVEAEAEARRLASEEVERPFDLARGPLVRAGLLRLGEREHVLVLTMHHIVSDGWSMGILFREISVLYEAFSKGDPSPLPALPIQYADFAIWQREWLQGEVLEEQLSYWRERLGGTPPMLNLPTDRPRPAVQTYRGASRYIELPKDLSEGLKELSRREGVTLFMTLLAAFQMLLYRYTGQEDISVGSPIANRNRAEIEGLIGFFVNTLVLRTDLSGNLTFRELLGRVREVCLEAYAHQDLPFEKLVEELQPERDTSRNPLFQVMFALQKTPHSEHEFHGLVVERFGVESDTTRFDLEVHCWETPGGLQTQFVYNADLFDGATIARMQGHFHTLLEVIVVNPEKRLSELSILTEAERQQLLIQWNDTRRYYPKDRCIHELFEARVQQTPNAVAVVFEDKQLTYRELNGRANQLAHHLRRLGMGPEILVGVCVERSLEMMVALLGILKAGGAYVPLDPSYPRERLAFICEDARLSMLVTQQDLLGALPQLNAPVLCLDSSSDTISREDTEKPISEATADHLAYIIYTSGSTGRPKGVAITHRSAVAFLTWAGEVYGPDELAGVLASTSICFDLSIFELFLPLTSGGKVILAESVLQLPSLAAAQEVTLVNTVPSAIAELLRIDGIPAMVRTVNLAGELLRTSLLQQIYQQRSVTRVYDLYGPSEGTTYSTCALRSCDAQATIGRPIANTQIYLLDEHMYPVPVGVSGAIYIGGAGLARGYLDRPEITAERFLPHPFSIEPGARLYQTGDLGRYLPDGNIEFLGRIDHQVKIRGFRIELGEIESALGGHGAVREAVVVARDDGAKDASTPLRDEKRLVAYIVPDQKQAPTLDELRSFLKEKLPEYMVPSVFVFLDALPLTPNGKVDRRALPTSDQGRLELESRFVVPRTPVEKALAGIWAEVLNLEQVGVHDNFFELGGHSLLATQVISRVRRALKVELPLRNLFDIPTVAGLAEVIMQSLTERAEPLERSIS